MDIIRIKTKTLKKERWGAVMGTGVKNFFIKKLNQLKTEKIIKIEVGIIAMIGLIFFRPFQNLILKTQLSGTYVSFASAALTSVSLVLAYKINTLPKEERIEMPNFRWANTVMLLLIFLLCSLVMVGTTAVLNNCGTTEVIYDYGYKQCIGDCLKLIRGLVFLIMLAIIAVFIFRWIKYGFPEMIDPPSK